MKRGGCRRKGDRKRRTLIVSLLTLRRWRGETSVSGRGTWRRTWEGRIERWRCSTGARSLLQDTRSGNPHLTAPDRCPRSGTRLAHICPAAGQTHSGHLWIKTGDLVTDHHVQWLFSYKHPHNAKTKRSEQNYLLKACPKNTLASAFWVFPNHLFFIAVKMLKFTIWIKIMSTTKYCFIYPTQAINVTYCKLNEY